MFEKFDADARQVIIKAHELANIAGHKSIRPTHVAVAAAIVLKKKTTPQGQMPFSSGTSTRLKVLDRIKKEITAEDLFKEFKGR